MVQLAGAVLWALGGALVGWLLLRYGLEPGVIRKIRHSGSDSVVTSGASLAVLRTLRGVLGGAIIAFAIAILGALALGLYLDRLGAEASTGATDPYARLVGVRDAVETLIDRISQMSLGIWALAVAGLSLIWVAVTYSSSKRRWTEAVEARRKAVQASAETLSPEELDQAFKEADQASASRLDSDIVRIRNANRDRISNARAMPVFSFGENGEHTASIAEITSTCDAILKGDPEEERPPEEQYAAEQAAANFKHLITEAEQQIKISLLALEGSDREYALAVADQHAEPDPSTISRYKRDKLVEARIKAHKAEGNQVGGREPELISEWLGAAATGNVAVKSVSKLGQVGGFAATVALILGLLGISAPGLGSALALRAEAYEIGFVDAQASLAVKQAEAQTEPTAEQMPAEATEMASDAQTTQFVRSSFRSAFASGLRQSIGVSPAIDRAAFNIGAQDARRTLLAAAAREAAPSAELGVGARETFVTTHSPAVASANNADAYLDEAIDRRVAQVRQNESLWTKFRREALKPVPPNQAGEALLRTVLGTDVFPNEHAFRVAADRAAGAFTSDAIRLGSVTQARTAGNLAVEVPATFMTARDQRLIGDFKRTAPQRVETVAASLVRGDFDPGSLHRVSMSVARAPGPIVPAAMRGASAYAEIFPAVAEAAFSGVGGGGGRSARSYARIRFSPKVGGVVIGREPEAGGEEVSVVGFDWTRNADGNYQFVLTTADNRTVDLGPFHPALIYGALAYAADGRVVTATLPKPTGKFPEIDGQRIQARRVLVHPALEDTSVACPVIQIDRFVDGFTSGGTSDVAQNLAVARDAVSVFGLLIGEVVAYSSYQRQSQRTEFKEHVWDRLGIADAQPRIAAYVNSCGTGQTCFPTDYYQSQGLDFGNSTAALQCLANGGDCFDDFVALTTSFGYLVDSGVREQNYTLDGGLNFLRAGADRDFFWPLDFIIQAVPQKLTDDDADSSSDFEPWIFPSMADGIRALVRDGIESNPDAAKVLAEMKDFVVLQRLFRLALAGSVGLEFPLHRLGELQAEVQPAMKVQRNERWNLNDSVASLLLVQAESVAESLTNLKDNQQASPACRQAATDALSDHVTNPWPQSAGIWKRVGLAASACEGATEGTALNKRLEKLRANDLIDDAILYAETLRTRAPLSCEPL